MSSRNIADIKNFNKIQINNFNITNSDLNLIDLTLPYISESYFIKEKISDPPHSGVYFTDWKFTPEIKKLNFILGYCTSIHTDEPDIEDKYLFNLFSTNNTIYLKIYKIEENKDKSNIELVYNINSKQFEGTLERQEYTFDSNVGPEDALAYRILKVKLS